MKVGVGLFGGAAAVAPVMLATKAASLLGSHVGTLADLRELMALAQAGMLPPLEVGERPLDAANAALEDPRERRVLGRVVRRAA